MQVVAAVSPENRKTKLIDYQEVHTLIVLNTFKSEKNVVNNAE